MPFAAGHRANEQRRRRRSARRTFPHCNSRSPTKLRRRSAETSELPLRAKTPAGRGRRSDYSLKLRAPARVT